MTRTAAWMLALAAGCMAATAGAAGKNPRSGSRAAAYVDPPPVTDTGALGEWLMRLVDRYRVDGAGTIYVPPVDPVYQRASSNSSEQAAIAQEAEFIEPMVFNVKGSADCAAVGAGPGVQCIFNIGWKDQFEVNMDPDKGTVGIWNLPGGISYLNPSMMLVGLEPASQGLHLLLVDNKGLPEAAPARVAGDRATLRAECVNAPVLFGAMNPEKSYERRLPDTCERITRIDARSNSKVVHIAIDIQINRQLVTQLQLTLRRDSKNKKGRP